MAKCIYENMLKLDFFFLFKPVSVMNVYSESDNEDWESVQL